MGISLSISNSVVPQQPGIRLNVVANIICFVSNYPLQLSYILWFHNSQVLGSMHVANINCFVSTYPLQLSYILSGSTTD
jgi:hypothetical protein